MIKGLSDKRRLPRLLKIRLGVKKVSAKGNSYPTETDYFVLAAEDGATPEILKLYAGQPKALRLMLPFDVDSLDPRSGDELVWNVSNRAYGRSHGLKCKGDGGSAEESGTAETDDKGWADRIGAVTHSKPELLKNGRFAITCRGRDCPKYHLLDDDGKRLHDEDSACRATVVLRAFLLDPTHLEEPRVLGLAEIVSGSYNSMLDVRSSFDVIRAFTGGRTAGIPFTLIRRPMRTKSTGPFHYTLTILPTAEDWQRAALTPPSQVFLSKAQRQELQALAAAPLSYDSVKDVLPTVPLLPAARIDTPNQSIELPVTDDRDETLSEKASEPDGLSEPELDRRLTQAERDELKVLCGGVPGKRDTQAQFRDLVAASYVEFESWDPGETAEPPLDRLTVRHKEWIRGRLEPALVGEVVE